MQQIFTSHHAWMGSLGPIWLGFSILIQLQWKIGFAVIRILIMASP